MKPSYEKVLNSGKPFASVASNDGKKDNFNLVSRRRALAPKKVAKPKPIMQIRARERHLKVGFIMEKKTVTNLGKEQSTDAISITLNQCLTGLDERMAYFSVCGMNRFGDILLTLADNMVDDIMVYIEALRISLVDM